MIRAAGRVEAQIVPIAKIAEAPGRNTIFGTVGGRVRDGASEAGVVELVPGGRWEGNVGGVVGDLVVTGFIVGLADEERLFEEGETVS